MIKKDFKENNVAFYIIPDDNIDCPLFGRLTDPDNESDKHQNVAIEFFKKYNIPVKRKNAIGFEWGMEISELGHLCEYSSHDMIAIFLPTILTKRQYDFLMINKERYYGSAIAAYPYSNENTDEVDHLIKIIDINKLHEILYQEVEARKPLEDIKLR